MIKKILGNKKIIAVGILVFLLLAVGAFMPLSIFGDGAYHTGIPLERINNCETEHHKVATTWWIGQEMGSWYGNVETGYGELISVPFDNGPVVTAMSGGEGKRSVSITVEGTVTYAGAGTHTTWWWPDTGWYEVDVSSNGYGWDTIISTRNNQINYDIIGDVAGATTAQKYKEHIPSILPGWPSPIAMCSINSFSFNIKDTQVGAIRIRQMAEFKAAAGTQSTIETVSTDYCLMISGEGDVSIVDPQTRYIAGEDTIRFKVNTGYSGSTQGGEYSSRGWELKVYNNVGDLEKIWYIDDDKIGGRHNKDGVLLDYPIPEDAVTPGQSHQWSVVLTNTLFDQDDETFFAITKEELAQAPGIKPITFGDSTYNLGDTVVINLEGIPNPTGRNKIDGFLVNILYGKDGVDYVLDYHNKYVSSTGNTATISFISAKGDKYITVEAWAFDYPESQGGIMSEKATAQIWVKEKEPEPLPVEFDWIGVAIASLIVIIGLAAAIALPVNLYIKFLIPVIAAIIAIIVYLYFFTSGIV